MALESQGNRSQTEQNNDETLNTFSDDGNKLTDSNPVVNYTGMSNVGGVKIHELILIAGLLGLILFILTKIKRK